ncbi:MAG: ParB/RepB/Spo0J family partition protein [Bacteroidetes bacterium]|nr:ParB/RepB/Spo0J family partition protein [Bacteroidota bacterium]
MSTSASSRKGAALGRGLGALLSAPSSAADAPEGGDVRPPSSLYQFEDRVRFLGRVAELEIDQIRPNPYQPRKHFDETALEELAASIRQLGIIQPVTVRAMGSGRFEIISGERRLRASRRAGLKRIPAFVREADTEAMLEMAIVENVQREALNPIEVALGYQRLIEECGLNQEAVAAKVGKNRTTVTNFLRLLRLPPRVQAALRDGTLSAGHARALVALEDAEAQVRIMTKAVDEGLSVRDVEDLVRQAKDKPAASEAPGAPVPVKPAPNRDDLVLQQFADRLRSRLATQVAIKHKGPQGGRIEIAYYSNDDLERLLGALGALEG